MSRTSRLFELLELLQTAGSRSVPDLARRLHVDERTVRRDVDALRELGVPVEATRGRYGGYRAGSGYRMPPLMLDDAEALAVLIGLVQIAASDTVPAEATALATATAKVRRTLPRRLTERADTLLDAAVLAPSRRRGDHVVDSDVLLTVASGVRDRRPLALEYRDRSGQRSRRSLQPHDLVAYAGRWYLAGLDAASQEVRTFRLDRVASARLLRGTFPPPPAHDAVADLVDRLAGAEYRHLVVLRIRATESDVRRHLPAIVARLEPVDGDWLRATIHAESLTWLPGVLAALDRDVVIEQSDELRAAVADAADRLLAMVGT